MEIAKVISIDDDAIRKRFNNSWREYEERFNNAKKATGKVKPTKRDPDDKLDEILNHVRELSRAEPSSAELQAATLLLRRLAVQSDVLASRPRYIASPALRRTKGAGTPPDEVMLEVEPGDQVQHRKYGPGTVMDISGEGKKLLATVAFDTGQQVQIMVNDAPLMKIVG